MALIGEILAAFLADWKEEKNTVIPERTTDKAMAGKDMANTSEKPSASSTSPPTALTSTAVAPMPDKIPRGIPIPPKKAAS